MNVRIMTSNVWVDFFGNPVPPRDELLADIIAEQMPDAVAFQEMHMSWHNSVLKTRLFALGYAEVCPDLHGNPYNCTPVLYNANRFREVRSCFHLYSGPNDVNSKSYTAVCLEEKESGARIGMIGTHFWFKEDEEGNLAREQNARELIEGFDSLGDCSAVFCGGDYNCDEHSSPLAILADAGIVTSHKIAEELVNPTCTWHCEPVYDNETSKYTPAPVSTVPHEYSLDHILVRGNAKVRRYEVIADERARIVSDHSPVVIDAEI